MEQFLKVYEVLYKKAKVDLNLAKLALENFENGDIELDLEVVMFHLQQCAEKLIKSLMDYNKIAFKKTHDILELIECAKENNIMLIKNIENLVPLTDYSVEGRYAILHDDIEDAHKYIKFLEEFKAFVEDTVSK